jgi:hypothetical protein
VGEEFHGLGAVRDEAAAADAIRPPPSIVHKAFMFTEIVASTNIAGQAPQCLPSLDEARC